MENFIAKKYANREKELFSLGMSKNQFGFQFHGVHVISNYLIYMTEPDWIDYLENLRKLLNDEKGRIGATITEKQKLEAFCKSLGNITGPEIRDENLRELLEGTLYLIGQSREHLQEELTRII